MYSTIWPQFQVPNVKNVLDAIRLFVTNQLEVSLNMTVGPQGADLPALPLGATMVGKKIAGTSKIYSYSQMR
jgi:hypothetical protein